MVLKKKYQSQEAALATYDYTDIASGTGYSIFYGGNVNDGSVSGSYILADNAFYSERITTFTTVTNSLRKSMEADFDISFNLPRAIKGDMIINVPIGVERDDATGTTTCNVSGSVIHYDGTTKTSLGTFRSSDFTVDDAVKGGDTKVTSCIVPITLKKFKKGDILRVNVQSWGICSAAAAKFLGIGHDPKNQPDPTAQDAGRIIYDTIDTTFGSTVMEVHVPFRVDI